MNTLDIFQKFAVSCILGMLIGLERQYSHREDESFAGVRTFALVALLGTLAAMLSEDYRWILPVAFFVFGIIVPGMILDNPIVVPQPRRGFAPAKPLTAAPLAPSATVCFLERHRVRDLRNHPMLDNPMRGGRSSCGPAGYAYGLRVRCRIWPP